MPSYMQIHLNSDVEVTWVSSVGFALSVPRCGHNKRSVGLVQMKRSIVNTLLLPNALTDAL